MVTMIVHKFGFCDDIATIYYPIVLWGRCLSGHTIK